jgi:histidine ammonia-lyase
MTTPQQELTLEKTGLSLADVVSVARRKRPVRLSDAARRAMAASRGVVDAALRDGVPLYGINTGFGSLSREQIAPDNLLNLQRNLVRSHACGVGEALPDDVVRAMMLLLAGSLARGYSGVRPVVVESLIAMLNAGVTPVVPSVGSVGASGDLAPLAHLALVLIGEGHARVGQSVHEASAVPGGEALARAGIKPLTLEAKEGLALINGTHLMAAQGSLLCNDAEVTFRTAMAAAAMSIDAARGTDAFLDSRVHVARNQPGQTYVAARLRELLQGSEIIPSHQENDPRVQDPYSLRCAPQVLGAAWDCLGYVKQAVERELGAVTDNPLVFGEEREVDSRAGGPRGRIVSAGNFHGMPLAIPLDAMTIALAHVAGISERRTFWMLSALDPEARLRPYLSPHPGVSSGMMIAQYTAAACCNEIVGLATPASVSNIPTSAGMEDYNSFGPRAAAKARRALELVQTVVAIELLCAAQGIEAHRPLRSGVGVEAVHAAVRRVCPPLTVDRSLAPDIAALTASLRENGLS